MRRESDGSTVGPGDKRLGTGETEGQTVIHSYFLYPTYRKRSG